MTHNNVQVLIILLNIHLSASQNCYAQYSCNSGYMDKTEGKGYYWACGSECPGLIHYTDFGCNCACIPVSTCQPTASPTIPQPSVTPTIQPTAFPTTAQPTAFPTTTQPSVSPTTNNPTLSTAAPTTSDEACYPQNSCNDGYMDKTRGEGYNWECGTDCRGKIHYTDYGCNCACIPRGSCPIIDTDTEPIFPTPSPTDTELNQKGSTWQLDSLFESIPFWAYIIAAVILCCVLQICLRMCCKKKREKIHYFPTATGVNNNATQAEVHPIANHIIQPQQQLPVVFVTPQQKQLIFASQHVQVPSHSVVNVPTDIPMEVIATPQNNLIVNASAPIQDDVPPNYNDAPPPYEEELPAYEKINPEGQQNNNRQQETNC